MSKLDEILAATRERVERSRAAADMRVLEQMAASHEPRGFRKRLQAMAQLGPAVIAELKKASPSKRRYTRNIPRWVAGQPTGPKRRIRPFRTYGRTILSGIAD